jgi:hypothetical protein
LNRFNNRPVSWYVGQCRLWGIEELDVGSVVVFGDYAWQVLDVKEGKSLLLAAGILEQRDYHDKKEEITWESPRSGST